MTKTILMAAAMAATVVAGGAGAQTRGVTDTEILLGGVHDLSGVFAAVSTPAVNGANLLFEQAVLAEGGQLEDPASLVKRLNGLLLAMS